ncbi:MAG: Gfo/Idh/MocA family oxidoreductase [Deltaproteobacteria bacterium]|nr:Gfo/Idh/MocA family oxidoreductase [Deltaproteobacteria bacterium]
MAKIGIVGLGYWGPNLLRNFYGQPLCSKLWACDSDPKRIAHMQTRFPGVTFVTSYDELLQSDIDGVAIATPVNTHYPLAKQALNANKHVFIEKPLAASVEKARDLVSHAATNKLTIMVGHTFEYSPPVIKIKELIERGELGRIFFISSMRVNLGLHQRDVSVIWDLAPHDLSMLFSWLKEKPKTVSATGAAFVQQGIFDVAFISAVFPSGCIAHLEVSWLAPSKLRRTAIVGDKKMLVYDDTETVEKVKIFDRGVNFKSPESFGEFHLSYRTGDIWSPKLDQTEPLALETLDFLLAIDKGKIPRADGHAGLRVVEALAAAQKSLEQGGVPIALDL